jgi:peptidoglycan/xylan/chitin deacetylase (PgdA/CDA1 family)
MKKRPVAEVEPLLSEIDRLLAERGVESPSPGDDEFMTWDELRTLAATARIDIGSHLCSHTPMPALTEEQLRAELVESKRRITAEVGKPVEAIAYPNGDYTEAGLALARQTGYSLGFSVESGCLRPGDDPLRIRRLNIAQAGTDTDAGFLARLAGVF